MKGFIPDLKMLPSSCPYVIKGQRFAIVNVGSLHHHDPSLSILTQAVRAANETASQSQHKPDVLL